MNVVRNQFFCSLNDLAMLLLLLLPFSWVLRFGQLTSNKSRNNHFGIDFQQQEGHVMFSRHACGRTCVRASERPSTSRCYCWLLLQSRKICHYFTEINHYRQVFSFKKISFEAFPLTNCVFLVCIQTHFNVFVLISYQKWHQERKSI